MDTEPYERLRQLREMNKYDTPKEAAEAFGWNVNTYKSHENGERGIRPSKAVEYAKAFKSTGFIVRRLQMNVDTNTFGTDDAVIVNPPNLDR